jgi:hypothetical protein
MKTNFNRYFFWLMIAILPNLPCKAQVVATKQIYLWDVTLSMKDNGIWDQVKVLLKKNVSEIPDKSTDVIIIPYQDDVYPEKRFRIGDEYAVDAFLKWVSEYDVPMPKGGHGTNICKALERAQDFVVKEKINTVFLLTDGVHEPKRPDMKVKYPPTCLDEFICEKWCDFATRNNAFLIYYQLFGKDYDFKKCSVETCRVSFIPPDKSGQIGPDLFTITPQSTLISKDYSFFTKPIVRIPVTTNLPEDKWKTCQIFGTISAPGFMENFQTKFSGSEITFEMSKDATSKLKVFCKNSKDYSELTIKLKINKNKESIILITPDVVPLRIKNSSERWMELKVLSE